MAVTLPGFTIQDDAVGQKVLDAFKGGMDPATGAALTPQQAYRIWLRNNLIEYVARMRADAKALARKTQDDADLAAERKALQDATAPPPA